MARQGTSGSASLSVLAEALARLRHDLEVACDRVLHEPRRDERAATAASVLVDPLDAFEHVDDVEGVAVRPRVS